MDRREGETDAVESVLLGYTILQTDENRQIGLSNSFIANATWITHTKTNPCIMPVFSIGYGADINNARAIGPDLAPQHVILEEAAGSRIFAWVELKCRRLHGGKFRLRVEPT